MSPEDAAVILKSLVDGRDPTSGKELPPNTVYQRANVIRALLVGCSAIETCLAREKRRAQLPVRVGSTWSTEEDERLRAGFQAGQNIEALASEHQRTPNAIQARLERLNLVPLDERAKFLRFPVAGGAEPTPRKKRRRGSEHDADRHSRSGNSKTE
jgi:hypothetical protein